MTRHFLSVWQPCRATSLFDQSVSRLSEDKGGEGGRLMKGEQTDSVDSSTYEDEEETAGLCEWGKCDGEVKGREESRIETLV